MDKQKGIEILEELLEKANNYNYLWEGELSPIQEASPLDFAYRKDNKLNIFGFWSNYEKSIRFAPSKGVYVSVMRNKHTLDKNNEFCYCFNGNFFYPEEINIPRNSEQVYNLLEKIHRGEKNIEEPVYQEILIMKKFFNRGIEKALEITKQGRGAFGIIS